MLKSKKKIKINQVNNPESMVNNNFSIYPPNEDKKVGLKRNENTKNLPKKELN